MPDNMEACSAAPAEVERLRAELREKDSEILRLRSLLEERENIPLTFPKECSSSASRTETVSKLSNEAVARYSRQLILPELGVKGQLALANTSVLIVGAGGLGCPAAVYLAAAGIGKLGVVDYDEVELCNLHRQILHTEQRIGVSKSLSLILGCSRLNSSVQYVPYHFQLDSSNSLDIIQHYDIILDATDNVATRYLLNDVCVLGGKPLVSASALRFEGQLTVYNHNGGPCYRCLFPEPPPPETVTNCSDGGVVGVVPGLLGCLQALETIKMACGLTTLSQKLLLFDGLDGSFRLIKLRPRQESCCVCGKNPNITQPIDYEQFCGAGATDKDRQIHLLQDFDRVSPKEYKALLDQNVPHLLVDVRQPVELEICCLPKRAINIPINQILMTENIEKLKNEARGVSQAIVVCRRGNDSQKAVRTIKHHLDDSHISVKDLRGGLTAWAKQIDPNFPVY